MSVSIRLSQVGKKNAPSFRIVAVHTRSKRDGQHLEILGHFNPSGNPQAFKVNLERVNYWQGVGAITSPAVKQMLTGNYKFVKYEPKKSAAAVKAQVAET